jgi:hypothetical protein
MPKQLDLYRQRYIQAVRSVMAEQNIETYKDIAPKIKTTPVSLSAIIQKRQYPTVQNSIDLCSKYGFSANWLFLGTGQERITEQATLDKLLKAIQKI